MLTIEEYDDERIRTYSDAGFLIRQDSTGDLYEEAIDLKIMNMTYTETDIPKEENQETSDLQEILNILLGE